MSTSIGTVLLAIAGLAYLGAFVLAEWILDDVAAGVVEMVGMMVIYVVTLGRLTPRYLKERGRFVATLLGLAVLVGGGLGLWYVISPAGASP